LKRRVKADVDLNIPAKRELLVYCPMSKKQHDFYEKIVSKTLAVDFYFFNQVNEDELV